MWFDGWSDILRVVLVGAAAYVSLVLLLRVSGKRTLAKLSAFDFVVTVALGSTLAAVVLDSAVSWADGVAGLATLVGLQLVVATGTARIGVVRRVVTAAPTILLRDGRERLPAMTRHRVGMDELRQAVRSSGLGDLAMVSAVVLETDGTLSVISRGQAGDGSALEGIEP